MATTREFEQLQPFPECDGTQHLQVRELLAQIGNKWTMTVLCRLAFHPRGRARFSELERLVAGISQRVLTTTLRDLERSGIVHRHFYAEVPPRVEYELSPLGKSLTVPIYGMVEWVMKNSAEVDEAKARFDQRRTQAPKPIA